MNAVDTAAVTTSTQLTGAYRSTILLSAYGCDGICELAGSALLLCCVIVTPPPLNRSLGARQASPSFTAKESTCASPICR